MRVLGVDFGGTRIGLAVADTAGFAPRTKPVLAASGTLAKDAAALVQIMRKEEAERIILGIPVTDPPSRMTRVCQTLAERLREAGAFVETVDESFTSQESEEALRQMGAKASQVRRQVDGEAAVRILERWWSQHGEEAG